MMFRVVSTLLLLQSFVSRPIPIDLSADEKTESEPNQDIVQPSCNGEGQFRDPLEILGKDFPEKRTVHLCKADLYMFADQISDVKFPPDGIKLCRAVCNGYMDTMVVDSGSKISLSTANCDYTGNTVVVEREANGTHPAKCPDLSTACVCTFDVRCNRRTKSVIYTFSPNCVGHLRVDLTHHTKCTYIT